MKLEKVIAVRTTKTIYRDGDKAIKLFNEDYSKSDVLNEALNQARIEETGINIPKVLEVCLIDGKWGIVSEFIAGKTLQRIMDEDPDNQLEYLKRFVEIQMEIHDKRAPMLNMLKEKMHRKIDASTLDATARYELHTRLNSMPMHNKVCHGDFNPSNVIITEDDKAYVIDWAHATQGNASADAARTYLLFTLEGNKELAERYLSMFCKRADIARQYVQKWIPIVAASQSVKGRPEERELLLKWADVVEYE